MEVLREQWEHCLNYSKAQLPSAPRSKAEDYQQPAVMRPRWLEITGTAWYTLPPTTALLQETAVEHPEKDNSNLVMWVSLHVNLSSSARCTVCDTAAEPELVTQVSMVCGQCGSTKPCLSPWLKLWCSICVTSPGLMSGCYFIYFERDKTDKDRKAGKKAHVFMNTHYNIYPAPPPNSL